MRLEVMQKQMNNSTGEANRPENTQHTPGPWIYDVAGYGNIRPAKHTGRNICVFNRCWTRDDYAEHSANARLIAAAPTMAKELRACLEAFRELQAQARLSGLEREKALDRAIAIRAILDGLAIA